MTNCARRAQGKRIFVTGRSLGTAAALYVAAHRPVAGLVLQNPPPLQSLILRRHGWWNLWLLAGPIAMQVPADLNSLRNAPKVTAPAVFVLAGPRQHCAAAVSAARGEGICGIQAADRCPAGGPQRSDR